MGVALMMEEEATLTVKARRATLSLSLLILGTMILRAV